MLSKSLIQFSVDGWGYVPFLLFGLVQTMVEVIKIMVTSFKRSNVLKESYKTTPTFIWSFGFFNKFSSNQMWKAKSFQQIAIRLLRKYKLKALLHEPKYRS